MLCSIHFFVCWRIMNTNMFRHLRIFNYYAVMLFINFVVKYWKHFTFIYKYTFFFISSFDIKCVIFQSRFFTFGFVFFCFTHVDLTRIDFLFVDIYNLLYFTLYFEERNVFLYRLRFWDLKLPFYTNMRVALVWSLSNRFIIFLGNTPIVLPSLIWKK